MARFGEAPALGQQGEVHSGILEEARWTNAGTMHFPEGAH
jgi:hypothetical protein